MCDECTWHHKTSLVQSVYWHLATKLYCCISLTHTSLDPYTHHSKLISNTDPLKPSTMFKKKTPSVSGTSISVFLRLRFPPSRGHPSQGHPSRLHPSWVNPSQGHPSRLHPSQGHPSQSAAPSVSGASVSVPSVSGASVSGTSLSETVTASTNDTNDHVIWRCVYIMSFLEQFQTALNIGSSNARTVTLNENLLLFGHDSHFKSNNTFDLIIFREKLYIYTCKINKNIP